MASELVTAAVKEQEQSMFSAAPFIPPDAIFALTAEYLADSFPKRVNLGQGTYRDENGEPWVLPSVRTCRELLQDQNLNHEYLPILGHTGFRKAAPKVVLGDLLFEQVQDKIACCQSLSGTGALHLAGLLLRFCRGTSSRVYIPDPTWSNHHQVFSSLGFECQPFPYYDHARKGLDFGAYTKTLKSARPNSVVVLHACAQNPTGCDPTWEQWREIGRIMKERNLFPLFDAAYLGFNSGSLNQDAFSIRYFVQDLEMEAGVCLSFAKNMGLYGERVGCCFVITKTPSTAKHTQSVLEMLQRSEISNPPAYGAKVATTILENAHLRDMWFQDLVTMSSRIRAMREKLHSRLIAHGAPGSWDHIIQQSGMFGFLGLPLVIVHRLKEQYHIYMADNSRISIAGLNLGNVDYVAQSIAETLK